MARETVLHLPLATYMLPGIRVTSAPLAGSEKQEEQHRRVWHELRVPAIFKFSGPNSPHRRPPLTEGCCPLTKKLRSAARPAWRAAAAPPWPGSILSSITNWPGNNTGCTLNVQLPPSSSVLPPGVAVNIYVKPSHAALLACHVRSHAW